MAKYIKCEAALALLRPDDPNDERCAVTVETAKRLIRHALTAAPAADVAPVVHGRWEQDADGDWYCTNCDEVVAICESGRERTYRKPYCPNCGAKMDIEGGGDSNAVD